MREVVPVMARTHIAAGVALAAVAAVATHHALDPAWLVMGGLGGLAPDLDHPRALLTRAIPGASALAALATATGAVRHRGVLHSWLAMAVAVGLVEPLLGSILARFWWAMGVGIGHPAWILRLWRVWGPGGDWGWAAGYASHLVVDTLNTTGVQWFWPLPYRVHSPVPNIPVGTPPETWFRWSIYLGLLVWRPEIALATLLAAEVVYRAVSTA
ncbi:Inner membrane protein [Candidatus Hydrogenisulfobacillus filiaventi]|uniref:Inner membrane protein n=1 Tax=Candidatus Hydrogenisulfobacillus filiaventi TaxID=2707344 RepID=A0A6F8ZJ27_9FIRM|nr:Inner membrane protein [Candidatus Hydrogenisulfobacillus filiaventi]